MGKATAFTGRKKLIPGVASVPLYDRYVIVWCGVVDTSFWVLTSSKMSHPVLCNSITGVRYKAMLENYVIPE